jgi:hypothetical protein
MLDNAIVWARELGLGSLNLLRRATFSVRIQTLAAIVFPLFPLMRTEKGILKALALSFAFPALVE